MGIKICAPFFMLKTSFWFEDGDQTLAYREREGNPRPNQGHYFVEHFVALLFTP